METIDLNRIRPERSEIRKMPTTGLVRYEFRLSAKTKAAIKKEAALLGISESLYLNAIINTRDPKIIKKTLKQS